MESLNLNQTGNRVPFTPTPVHTLSDRRKVCADVIDFLGDLAMSGRTHGVPTEVRSRAMQLMRRLAGERDFSALDDGDVAAVKRRSGWHNCRSKSSVDLKS